ncbi:MAG: 50S ribosomal protein L30 [Deltaproteobacteria bacterium]|jgi:large subunit ribosomal protein L30|nr:50S ribosomal protein L30 [Nannocystaceae bacterium]
MALKLKVTLVRSPIDRADTQKRTVKGLGLGKLNSFKVHPDNDGIRGMIRKVQHLVAVEAVE